MTTAEEQFSKSSYEYIIFDVSKPDKKEKPIMKKWEIWTGYYHLGQGHHGSTEPEKWGEEEASTFEAACLIHEHRQAMESIQKQDRDKGYVNHQSREWFYNWRTNSNSWIGKYYESKEAV